MVVLIVAADDGMKDWNLAQVSARNQKNNDKKTDYSIPFSLYENSPIKIDPKVFDNDLGTKDPNKKPTTVVGQTPPKPLISAEAYLVGNLDTSKVYVEHNSAHIFPIASLSKLVTALVAIHKMQADQKVTVTAKMLEAYGQAGHLVEGETLTVGELFYPLLLESSNDAAEAIAQSYGYDNFIIEMNNFVKSLGMKSTSFKDASGLSSGNSSNVQDLFTLAKYLYSNEKDLLSLTKKTEMTLASTTEHGEHVFHTINPFPYDPHFIGGKTGRTDEAKESMISMFRYVSGLSTYPVAIIVLRSDFSSREVDSSALYIQAIHKIQGN